MSDIYSEMALVASELLAPTSQGGFGQGTITLTKPGTSTPGENPWDPPIDGPPTVYTLQATAKGVSKEFINGTTIIATDIEVTAAAFPAEPHPADVLAISGKAVTVVKTWRVPAAGTLVCWKFVVRG